MNLEQNNRQWVHYEPPENCATKIGTQPNCTMVGMAQDEDGVAGAVIWAQIDGEYPFPVFLPSIAIGMVVSEAVNAATIADFPGWKWAVHQVAE